MNEENTQRLAGWLLGAWFLIHAVLFLNPCAFRVAVMALLLAGMLLRWLRVAAPDWLGGGLCGLAAVIPFWTDSPGPAGLTGAGVAAALLLGRMTPRRGLWVILCAIGLLASLTLDPTSDLPRIIIVLDAVLLMLFAEQIHSPEEARRGFREIVRDSLHLVIPVGAVVTAAFWYFPALSLHTNTALTGFADGLNPGAFSEMRQSRRTAFVATFPENSPVPPAGSLYWRGQSLENNHGLRWSRLEARPLPQVGQPATWWYSLQAMPGRTVFLLDVPLSITISGEPLSLQEPSLGTTAGQVEAESSATPANDPPDPRFAGGDLDVPKHIAADGRMRALQKEAFPAGRDVRKNLESLARFFKSSGFSYSMKFGRMSSDDVAGFLCGQRTGGCGHYAAASANLLRLAGIPARVVTGFRGGRWNPWLREITVRDSDAHAWVEAWDPAGRHWIRFDPTDFVAPELMLQIELERNPERWSWHMLAAAFVENAWSHSTRSIAPATAAAAVLALGLAVGWAFLGRRTQTDPAQAALARMEKYAARRNLGRLPEETPLAWLARLQCTVKQDDCPQLKRFAAAYERAVYSRTGLDAPTRSELRTLPHSFRHRGCFG